MLLTYHEANNFFAEFNFNISCLFSLTNTRKCMSNEKQLIAWKGNDSSCIIAHQVSSQYSLALSHSLFKKKNKKIWRNKSKLKVLEMYNILGSHVKFGFILGLRKLYNYVFLTAQINSLYPRYRVLHAWYHWNL